MSAKVAPIRKWRKPPAKAASVVDEYGRMDAKISAVEKQYGPQRKVLKAEILGWFEGAEPHKPFVVEGLNYTALISEKQVSVTIKSMPRLFKRLGEKLFLKLATFSLKHVDAHIPAGERGKFLTEERTGLRRMKCIDKRTEAAA